MKHFAWYDADGALRGYSSSVEPFPPEFDPNNPATTNPDALAMRDHFINKTGLGIVGCIAYECNCDCEEEEGACQCASTCCRDKYYENNQLHAKPALTIKVDGVVVPSSSTPINKTPGSSVILRLEATVPDGHEITLRRGNSDLAVDDPVLTFYYGYAEFSLTAPGQGNVGHVFGQSKYITPVVLGIRGWA